MIRKAEYVDIPRIFVIRAAVQENKLSNPELVKPADCEWFIDYAALWLWVEDGEIQGFSAADPRDGTIFALFVHPDYEGRGIARKLILLACETLKDADYRSATLTTDAGTRAEMFYRRDGWVEIGRQDDGQIIFRKDI